MSVPNETPPATNPSPTAPVATTAVDVHLRAREHPAAARRRVATFEAGRHFHRARVGVCNLAFRPHSRAAGRWNIAATQGLLAAVAAMSSLAEDGVGRGLELWLGGLRHGACSGERWEWLADVQDQLDQMDLCERPTFDLIAARNEVVQVYHDAFDAKREEVCGRLPGRLAGIFRLGELVEAGALPDAVFTPPAPAEEQAVSAPIVWGFEDYGSGRGDRNRLLLAPPRSRRFDLPWPTTWPAAVRTRWNMLNLREPPEVVLPGSHERRGDRAGRRTLINCLVAHAARLFGEQYAARLGLRDRLRVVDVGAQIVELDGRRIVIDRPRPFMVLRALIDEPSNTIDKHKLRKLPDCKGIDVSKELKKLPIELKGIIVSTGGSGAYYYFLLPDVEG